MEVKTCAKFINSLINHVPADLVRVCGQSEVRSGAVTGTQGDWAAVCWVNGGSTRGQCGRGGGCWANLCGTFVNGSPCHEAMLNSWPGTPDRWGNTVAATCSTTRLFLFIFLDHFAGVSIQHNACLTRGIINRGGRAILSIYLKLTVS